MSLLDKLDKEEFLFNNTSAYEKLLDRTDLKVVKKWATMSYGIYEKIGQYHWESDFKKCQ